jgi:sporulation protein YlmC with PRC-barrel domain
MKTTHPPIALSASTISGDTVKNTAGEKLGTIKDIMIDVDSGRVSYAVLDFGGFLGMGNKLFAVPWNALNVCPEEKCLLLAASKDVLKNAEGFDKDNWPNFADQRWGATIHAHYGVAPYWD